MKRLIVLIILLLAFPAQAAEKITDPSLLTVRISINTKKTGWYWNGSGVKTQYGILTAWHVLEPATGVCVWDRVRGYVASRWVKVPNKDAALIFYDGMDKLTKQYIPIVSNRVSGPNTRSLVIGYWGYSFGSGSPVKSEGALIPAAGNSATYMATNPIQKGMSGGPFIVDDLLAGLVMAESSDAGGTAMNFFCAITDSEVANLK